MRFILGSLASLALAAVIAVGAAGANGSPYSPGLAYGWPGVGARSDGIRFVAFGMPKSTIVAAIRPRDGRVLESRVFRGFYGVPLVAYDGTPGGLSGDGKSLVLGSYGPLPGESGKTRFLVLKTGTVGVRRLVVLPGSWSYDAISPDGSTLYLVEHISAGPNPRYRVRAFAVPDGRLLPEPIVDTRENEALMRGQPATRTTTGDGRWAYTLYARPKQEPFVHALDTRGRKAYCIDLPLELDQQRQMALRLKLADDGRRLTVRAGARVLADVDTKTFEVRKGG